ncbi:uncharacterized protein LOC132705652 [Cylas formicarius]|uniref:uncharacterized protein LOC132705652 n=1 Tax=Cylas formicarius TaxID=197179 RepID=UPI002958A7B4|nr:uncharacterized protein LOC132705652 [Cylas formicarius]
MRALWVFNLMSLNFLPWESYAIRCYQCDSKSSNQCFNPNESVFCNQSFVEKTLSYANSIHENYTAIFKFDESDLSEDLNFACLKILSKYGNRNVLFRGCQFVPQEPVVDICKRVEIANGDYLKNIHCSHCDTDLCNSAHNFISCWNYAFDIIFTVLLLVLNFGLFIC